MSLTLNDFKPVNKWKDDVYEDQWKAGGPKFLVDESTGKVYWNHTKKNVRIKCALLTLGTPLFHPILATAKVLHIAINLIALTHFQSEKGNYTTSSLKTGAKHTFKDLLKVGSLPLVLTALELTAIYGIFKPYDGRKLYATLEYGFYGESTLAPCFEASPQSHLFGGDPEDKNGY